MDDSFIITATERTLEQVNTIADIAGLSKRKGMVQILNFSDDLAKEEYKLLECSKDILQVISEGSCLYVRGEHEDSAVLCTDNGTYEIKAADTSNSLLLVPGLVTSKSKEFVNEQVLENKQICSCISTYYELKKIRPKLEKLKYLLEEAPYKGPEHEEEQKESGRVFNFEALLEMVQASEDELRSNLHKIGALKINGSWRILDIEYEERGFSQILSLLDEQAWSYLEVPSKATCDILEELYPRFVIEHCLKLYGDEIDIETDNQKLYRLSEDKVCQFFARCILRGAGKFNYHEFFEAWEQSVPYGMKIRQDHLEGLALSDMTSIPPVIWHFPSSSLPDDPSLRFNKLFKLKSKWSKEEIDPYIRELLAPGQSINALLLKYARCSTDSTGQKIYNSKRPIT